MRNLRLRLLLVVFVMLGIALVVSLIPSGEPAYSGLTLTEWVDSYTDLSKTLPGENDEAIRQIGTNAIPYLLKWIRYEEPAWKLKLYAAINPVLGIVSPSWKFNDGKKFSKASGAALALMALGPKAHGAVRSLGEVLNDPKVPPTRGGGRGFAANVLASLGSAGLPPLLVALANDRSPTALRVIVIADIGSMGTNALAAVPALVQLLKDRDATVRTTTTNALRQIEPRSLAKPLGQ